MPQQNVNRTMLSDTDFKAYSRSEQSLPKQLPLPYSNEVEEDIHHNNMRSAFRAIKTLAGQKQSQPVLSSIHKADGTPCRCNEEIMQRRSEHFTAAVNHLPAATSTSLESDPFLLFLIQT